MSTSAPDDRTRPVLVVQHEAMCPPGWVGDWLVEAGVVLDVRRPDLGEALPSDLDGHAGLVVMGGSMGAYDDERAPWLPAVRELVRRAADAGTPSLGICLGHQLTAVALGGRVDRSAHGQQVGVLEVGWTPEAADDPLLGPLTTVRHAVQWNNDEVTELPEGAVVLARSPREDAGHQLQAARFAPTCWGVQWHPEAHGGIVGAWADLDRDDARERGVDVDAYVAQVRDAEPELAAAWRGLATSFAALVRQPVAAG